MHVLCVSRYKDVSVGKMPCSPEDAFVEPVDDLQEEEIESAVKRLHKFQEKIIRSSADGELFVQSTFSLRHHVNRVEESAEISTKPHHTPHPLLSRYPTTSNHAYIGFCINRNLNAVVSTNYLRVIVLWLLLLLLLYKLETSCHSWRSQLSGHGVIYTVLFTEKQELGESRKRRRQAEVDEAYGSGGSEEDQTTVSKKVGPGVIMQYT